MNILHILSFKNYELIENFLKTSSYFKAIIHKINKLGTYLKQEDSKLYINKLLFVNNFSLLGNLLDQLIMCEEMPDMRVNINSICYNNIPLWK